MGLDFGAMVKRICADTLARPIVVTPVSGAAAYTSRGIWHEDPDDFPAEGASRVTDDISSIDVLNSDFVVIPRQGDRIDIPADATVPPAKGTPFTVVSAHDDGGGMTNLVLESYKTAVTTPPRVRR
jgi:hypothetical protein